MTFRVEKLGDPTNWVSVQHVPSWNDPLSYDTIFLRTRAVKASSSLVLDNLQIGISGAPLVAVPFPSGVAGPASTGSIGPERRDSLQIAGVDLRHGFVLQGDAKWVWSTTTGLRPQDSELAFQLKVGSWREPVVPAYADTIVPGHVGVGAGTAFGANGQDPGGMAMNGQAVRYYNGELFYQSTDLASASQGNGWGHSRFYANQLGYNADWISGNKWVVSQMPFLLQIKGESGVKRLVAVSGPNNLRWFEDIGGDTWQGFFFLPETLTHDAGNSEYVLVDSLGNVTKFHDFSGNVPKTKWGKLKAFTDPAGHPTSVNYTVVGQRPDPDPPYQNIDVHQITSITRGSGAEVEDWTFNYEAGPNYQFRIQSAEFRRGGGLVRRAEYEYYNQGDAYGTANDLKRVTIKNEFLAILDQELYRYQYDGVTNQSVLRLVVGGDNYERAVFAGLDPATATDTNLEPFADHRFTYDALCRVSQHNVQGAGSSSAADTWSLSDVDARGTITYSYRRNQRSQAPLAQNFNRWQFKTTEVRPNGSQLVTYANQAAEPMLQVVSADGKTYRTFYRYDSQGRLLWTANPSAISGHNENVDDLLDSQASNYFYLRDGQGLIHEATYNVSGYLETTRLKHGELHAGILQDVYTYQQQTSGNLSVRVLQSETAYRDDTGLQPVLTAYAYTLWTNLQPREIVTALPTVPVAENGPGTVDGTYESLDEFGRPVLRIDAEGYVHTTDYHGLTGAVLRTAVDALGLNLVTETLQFDVLGRPLRVRDANGTETTYSYVETAQVRLTTTTPPTGPVHVERVDRGVGYVEQRTRDRPTGAPIQALTRDYLDRAGRVVQTDRYFEDVNSGYNANQPFGLRDVDFHRSRASYDNLGGRQHLVENAVGTLTETVFDQLDRPIQTKVGVGLGTRRPVRSFVYDVGLAGDSNLTALILHPKGSTVPTDPGPPDRVTEFYHDWRNRQVASKTLYPFFAPVSRFYPPISYCEFDNLGRCLLQFGYDGTGFTVNPIVEQGGTATNVPTRPTDPNLTRSKVETRYDQRGRVFRTLHYQVTPIYNNLGDVTAATVGTDAIQADNWYDRRGNVVKAVSAGKPVSKMRHDGAGRLYWQFVTDGGGDTTWTDATTVFGDVVLEEVEKKFDSNGNTTFLISRQRNHNAPTTGTGELPFAFSRWSYVGNWYDAADRLTQSVNFGTWDGAQLSARPALPARVAADGWDDFLRTDYTYDVGGWLETTTDPRSVVTLRQSDKAGRVLFQWEAFTDGQARADSNRITGYGYDGLDRVRVVNVYAPGGTQQTAYIYGGFAYTPTGPTPQFIESNDLLREIRYPNRGTGVPSLLEQDQEKFFYSALGETIVKRQRTFTLQYFVYDQLGRLTQDIAAQIPAYVDGTVRQLFFEFDSFGNAARFRSLDAAGGIVNDVLRTYNGFGQVLREYQKHDGAITDLSTPPPFVYYLYDSSFFGSRPTGMEYPSGRRVHYVYGSSLDSALSRISSLYDPNATRTLEQYAYLGLSSVVERARPEPNLTLSYVYQDGDLSAIADGPTQYTGLDRFGRVIDQYWFRPIGTTLREDIDRYQYAYDAQSNRLYRDNLLNPALGELYHANQAVAGTIDLPFGIAYDLLGRQKKFQRGTLARYASEGRINIVSGTPSAMQEWTLDALGNWTQFRRQDGGPVQTYDWTYNFQNLHNGFTVDDNGNYLDYTVASGPQRHGVAYDAWNRLLFSDAVNGPYYGAGSGEYRYDALGRTLRTFVHPEDLDNVHRHLFHTVDGQEIAEYTQTDGGALVLDREYVWGLGYPRALVMTQDATGAQARLYPTQDANWNVTGLIGNLGGVAERYVYEPYGQAKFLQANWAPYAPATPTGQYKWKVLHQGQRLNPGDGMYAIGARMEDPFLGRWLQSDPLGYTDGMNRHEYLRGTPASETDPSGTIGLSTLVGTLLGGVIGFVAGGFSGEKFFDWDRAWAGAGSGALVGAGIGLAIDTLGLATPLTVGLVGLGIGSGIGSAAGGGLFGSGAVDMAGFYKGALIGGIMGFTGGFASAVLAPFFGGGALGGATTGFFGGWIGDSFGQSAALALGWQKEYNPSQTLIAGAFGASLGGLFGYRGPRGNGTAPAANARFGLRGVTDSQASALSRTLRNIQVEGRPVVASVEAFGSRAGSTFRGRPPTATSDLDVFVTLRSEVVNSAAARRAVLAELEEIQSLFSRSMGFRLEIVSEIDTLAPAVRQGLQRTPFIRLE